MDRDRLLERTLNLGEEEDWEGMAEFLREHLTDFEDDPAVHCWLGVAERELGAEGIAYERFKRALALEPQDPYVLATAGNGIASFDDPEAEQALRSAALLAPDVALARMLYGAYLAREGLYEEAGRELEAACELAPDDPQARYELGVLLGFQERWDGAADALADATRLDPEDGWVRTMFGLILLEAGRLDEAAGELVEGARARPDDVDAQLAAALACGATGRDDLAYEMVERARIRALEGDLALVTAVEDRLDEGPESAARLLEEGMGASMLRSRLTERP
jgi:Flp pilus assembly protein TadD